MLCLKLRNRHTYPQRRQLAPRVGCASDVHKLMDQLSQQTLSLSRDRAQVREQMSLCYYYGGVWPIVTLSLGNAVSMLSY